jgi:long-chain fatty acid transport protein
MATRTSVTMVKRFLVLGACGLLAAAGPAAAGNGHYLPGVGAVNSSLGGAGVGLPFDVLGSLSANPALLVRLTDNHVEISAEVFGDNLSATTNAGGTVPGFPTTPVTIHSNGQLGVLPALAWSIHQPGKDYAFGFGLMAIAGFRTNYPADHDSLLTAPTDPSRGFLSGFGRLQTDLAVTKIPLAVAWQATPQLALGLSLNVYQGALVIQPLPVVPPDCDIGGGFVDPATPNAVCYRPSTSGQVTSYSAMPQVGAYFQVNPVWSVGASFTPRQSFPDYRWNSANADPNITTGPHAFGLPRKIGINIDGPPIASFGVGIQPNPQWKIAVDGRWMGYSGTAGIGGAGGIQANQVLTSIGWQDIWIGMLGVQWQATPKLTLRGGLNFNQSPIRPHFTLNSSGTPSVFEQHYALGATVAVLNHFDVDLGVYYVPSNSKTGPILGPNNFTVPGTSITLTNGYTSGQIGFSFHF